MEGAGAQFKFGPELELWPFER